MGWPRSMNNNNNCPKTLRTSCVELYSIPPAPARQSLTSDSQTLQLLKYCVIVIIVSINEMKYKLPRPIL